MQSRATREKSFQAPSWSNNAVRSLVTGDARFLAFAFAGADLLVEFDENWNILYGMSFADGKVEGLRAKTLYELVDATSLPALMSLPASLEPNTRAAAANVVLKTLDGPQRAVMRAFRSRDLGSRISCTFSLGIELPKTAGAAQSPPSVPMLAAEDFIERVSEIMEDPRALRERLYLTFVEVAAARQLGDQPLAEAIRSALSQLEALFLRSAVNQAAAKVAAGRYVLLTNEKTPLEQLDKAIDGLGAEIAALLAPRMSQAQINDPSRPGAGVRAVRYAIDRFLAQEGDPDVATLAAELSTTFKDAGAFRVAVKDRKFKLAYQPIVRLADEKVHAYEALLRIPGKDNTAASIRMAEQLGLIDQLDVAVAEAAWRVLEADRTRELSIAINISGGALRDDGYVQGLIAMTKRSQSMRNRFCIEITERAALEDLEGIDRRVQVLRKMGFNVCVDDFGAGAASFDYLRALNIDTIKIDGRYVRELATSQRSRLLVGHFVRLCAVLNIKTVGARTEDKAAADSLRELGVDYAQGWHYGHPVDEPRTTDKLVAPRRKGLQETWQ
ncbi:EAL domain-containing protein [Phenylobacterium montanum]|uniref:EAL domain-containing protein n=1 Tax=Phenylobacterium montanum TaxID=2823693 RepID=A0A975FYA2_9CAUL|nr:EAL domain-containing protein [Caulobacter sp. S6]QUD86516.1 EAL domain-containing protein [Caulobacter sp. S6]